MKNNCLIVVMSMGESSSIQLKNKEGVVVYDCIGKSFGDNFKAVINKFRVSNASFLIVIDGDIKTFVPVPVIVFLARFFLFLGFDHVTFGRIERFALNNFFAQGGIRFYSNAIFYKKLKFFNSSDRPETDFIVNNISRYLKFRFPLGVHEFYLRPSEANRRAIQRREKSVSNISKVYYPLLNTATEAAFQEGILNGNNQDKTLYFTDLSEEPESYGFVCSAKLLLGRVHWVIRLYL